MISALLLALALPQTAPDPHAGHAHAAPPAQTAPAPQRMLQPIPLERVKLAHRFFVERLRANHQTTIPHCLDQCEKTGSIANFSLAAAAEKGQRGEKPKGKPDDDSNVYMTLEAIGWTLVAVEDAALEARADAIVDAIAAAQRADGYLNTFVQRGGAEPWKDLAHGHELDSGGHLIEAGIAYARGTGKTKLLDVGTRFATLVDAQFGPGKRAVVAGHAGIELALAKLHEHTQDARWLKLAQAFLDRRGDPARKERFGESAQDHEPIREQTEVVGRAVGAGYLYAGAAEVAMQSGDASLVAPLTALWADAWDTKTLLTGGIASSAESDGITRVFDLPNDTATCETCAGIALAVWSQRMLLLTGESKYGDAVERILYNHAAAGANLAGDRFFQDQPLASRGDKHRQPWFETACCPPNLARFWAQVPGLVFAQNGNSLYWLQLASAEIDAELAGSKVHAKMESDLPNSGRMNATITCDKTATFTIKLRRPGWNVEAMVKHDMKEAEHELHEHEQGSGWVPFERKYEPADGFLIHFLAPIRRVRADERVEANKGRVALARGPLIYCFEGVDNGGSARSLILPAEASLEVKLVGTILGGTRTISARGRRAVKGPDGATTTKVATVTAVPYYLWDNRAAGDMVIWVPETPELAEVQGEGK